MLIHRKLSTIEPQLRFSLEALAMIGLPVLLFRRLITRHSRDMHLLVLACVVFGVFFRGLSSTLKCIL